MEPSQNPENTANSDPYIGKEIEKYIVIEPLDEGGMGVIYKARHKNIKRMAALKLLPVSQAADEMSIKRLEREATAMGNLQHANIATMYDFGINDFGQPYIVMELINGQSLKELFKESGSLDPIRAIRLFIQICDGMDYAHSKSVIHRDLKPANIMVTDVQDTDQVKILDFGIARKTDESLALTKTGQIMGSASYMSPEQCTGKKPVDFRTDIYALGVMMYELLTGKLPYKGDTFLQTIFLKTTEHPKPFPDHLKQMRDLESLTLRCLKADPEDRPVSMKVVKEELETILQNNTATMVAPKTQDLAFNKDELDNIASGTDYSGDTVANTIQETKTDHQNTVVNQDETKNIPQGIDRQAAPSPDFKKYGIIAAVAIAALISIVAVSANFMNNSKSNTEIEASKKSSPTTEAKSANEEPTDTIEHHPPITGASHSDSLMVIPKKEETKPTQPRSPKKSRTARGKYSRTKPKSTTKSMPPKAPPRAKQTAPVYNSNTPVQPAPPIQPVPRVQTPKPKYKAPNPREVERSYKHHRRKYKTIKEKSRNIIKKFKKIF